MANSWKFTFGTRTLSMGAIVFLVILLPYYWLHMPVVGKSFIWLAMAVLVGASLFKFPQVFSDAWAFISQAKCFHIALISYVLLYAIASAFRLDAPNVALKQGVLYLQFLLIGSTLQRIGSKRDLADTFLTAIPASLFFFLVFVEAVFRMRGTTFYAEFSQALAAGSDKNVSLLIRSLAELNDWDKIPAIRNLFGSFINLCFFGILAFWPAVRRSTFAKRSRCYVALVTAPIILIVVLLSRAAIVSIFVGLLASMVLLALDTLFVKATSAGRRLLFNSLVALVGLSLTLVIAVSLFGEGGRLIENSIDRFAKVSQDARVAHYQLVVDAIRRRPIVGYGAAELAPDGMEVHNFLLGGWFQIGAAGLLASLAVWGSLFFDIGRNTIRHIKQRDFSIVSPYFAPALAIQPIWRRAVAGDCGRFTLMELVAVAILIVAIRPATGKEED